MTTDFKIVPQAEFKAMVEGIDKRRFKVTKRLDGTDIHWYWMPIQRRGLFRSAIRDVDKTLFACTTPTQFKIGVLPT